MRLEENDDYQIRDNYKTEIAIFALSVHRSTEKLTTKNEKKVFIIFKILIFPCLHKHNGRCELILLKDTSLYFYYHVQYNQFIL